MTKLQQTIQNAIGDINNFGAQIERMQEKLDEKRWSASKRIGAMLRVARKEKYIKQQTLAAYLGIKSPTLSLIEAGDCRISLDLLKKMEKWLEVNV